jgi:hypothetical protein
MTDQDPTRPASASAEEPVVRISVHADAGARPVGTGAKLVEEALTTSDCTPGTPVSVAVPAGDAEMVARLHDLLEDEDTRRAGATTIVDGVVGDDLPTGSPGAAMA